MINVKASINPTKEELAIAAAQDLKQAQTLAKNISSMVLSRADAIVIARECAFLEKYIGNALENLNKSIFK